MNWFWRIVEAAQNIVKHAYQNQETDDKMEIKISQIMESLK